MMQVNILQLCYLMMLGDWVITIHKLVRYFMVVHNVKSTQFVRPQPKNDASKSIQYWYQNLIYRNALNFMVLGYNSGHSTSCPKITILLEEILPRVWE